MKKYLLPLFMLLLCVSMSFAQNDSIAVTFQVDLSVKVAEGLFVPGEDGVTIRGSFMDEIGLSGDWFPSEGAIWMEDTDHDTIFTKTVKIPNSYAGTLFEFKYQINDAIWEGDPNRNFTLDASSPQLLPLVYFDRDTVVNLSVINTLNFTLDMTDIYGSGLGFFDPATDSVMLMGLDWSGAVVIDSLSDRTFREDPFNPGVFHATMTIKGVEGDSTRYKCKAEPEADFFNWGWEITPDKWHFIKGADAVIDVPAFKPDIFPIKPPLTDAVTILFQVDMTHAANFYTDDPINPADLIFVGLKGQNSVLGSWGGDWMPSDTSGGTLQVLNDSGENGDKSAGDNIWSANITFPLGNDGGPGLYKYGAMYSGADTINGGYHPLDNEMQDKDHWVNVMVGGPTEVMDYFGSLSAPTAIEPAREVMVQSFVLEQNYPNPFNPVTTIRYTLPASSEIQLNVYNILGQRVTTLFNGKQNAGIHQVRFDASFLGSGVYFYELSSGKTKITRKMLLMK